MNGDKEYFITFNKNLIGYDVSTYLDGTTKTSGATFTYAVDDTPAGISVGADGKVSLDETTHAYDVDCTVTITATVTTDKISGFVDPKYTVKFTA